MSTHAEYERMASKLDALAGNARPKFEDEPPQYFSDVPPIGEQQQTEQSQDKSNGGAGDVIEWPEPREIKADLPPAPTAFS